MSDAKQLGATDLNLSGEVREGNFFTLREVRSEAERKAIHHAPRSHDGNVSQPPRGSASAGRRCTTGLERLGLSVQK